MLHELRFDELWPRMLKGAFEMTNYEKMQAGELSNYKDAEIVARNSECARLMRAFNATGIDV